MSHRTTVLVLVIAAALAAPASATIQSAGGLALGTSSGLGGQAHVTLSQIAQGMPFSARFGLGYWRLDPGDALDARHVFINANSNGDPKKSGHRWDMRFDVINTLQKGPLRGWDLALGPRYSKFRGDYDFVGGNETFYITSDQWGAGAAFERRWPTGPETELMISAGFDWFANSTLSGHDSSYSPDGSSVSPVDEYTWKDADEAIHQPRYSPRFVVGVQHHFGR